MIDWNLINPPPPQPNRELADIGSMLSAIAERKHQQMLQQQQLQQQQAHFAAQQAELAGHHRALEGYNAATLAETQANNLRVDERARLKAQEDRAKYASEGVPDVSKAFEAGGAQAAEPLARARGMQWRPATQQQASPTDNLGPDDQMAPGVDAPVPGKFEAVMPAGDILTFEEGVAQAHRRIAGARAAETWRPSVEATVKSSPFGKQAAQFVEDALRSGEKIDPNKSFIERMQHLEDQANATRRAAMVPHPPKTPPDTTVLDINGNEWGNARTDLEGKKLREQQAAAAGLVGSIGRLRADVIKTGRGGIIPGSEAEADRDALISDTTSYLTTLFNTGVLNAGEYERYKRQLNTSIVRGGKATASGLDQMLTGVKARYEAKLKSAAVPMSGGRRIVAPGSSEDDDAFLRQLEAGGGE